MENLPFNWMAMVAAALIPLATGFLWYGPLFGKAWMQETGMTEEKAKQMNPAKTYGLTVLFTFILTMAIYPEVFTGGMPPDELHNTEPFLTFKHGALHGAFMGILIVMPAFAVNALFEQKSFKYVAINVGYWIVTMVLMGGIINAWI